MNVMVFAAGIGSRLKPYTDTCPKALVEVAGKPMLEHLLLKLKAAGCGRVVINVHHFGQQILDFLAAHQSFGMDICISDERAQLLDTGGGLRKAYPLFANAEPILVHNVDIFSNLDLQAFYQTHLRSGAEASLLVSCRVTNRYLYFDENRVLKGWKNLKTGEVKSPFDAVCKALQQPVPPAESTLLPFAFSGIHVLSPSLFPALEHFGEVFSVIDFYLASALAHLLQGVVAPDGFQLVDAGKPESLAQAARMV